MGILTRDELQARIAEIRTVPTGDNGEAVAAIKRSHEALRARAEKATAEIERLRGEVEMLRKERNEINDDRHEQINQLLEARETLAEAKSEIAQLRIELDGMKGCHSCAHRESDASDYPCEPCRENSLWELWVQPYAPKKENHAE